MTRIAKANRGNRKRSPLDDPPLRAAGQSLEAQLDSLVLERAASWILVGVMVLVFAALEWARWYFKWLPQPLGWTIIAAVVVPVAIWRVAILVQHGRRLRLAIDGEVTVGQSLESLRLKGYRVFHDILEDGFNIDHALIGPGGVFSIETKTISKPVSGRAVVSYDGERVLIDGLAPDRDPVVQARAAAARLRAILERSTGMKRVSVRPIVLYPGWYVEKQPKGVDVWVLNPKALPAFLDREKQLLSADQVSLLAYHLSRHVLEKERRHGA